MAHITGGGLIDNVARILPEGVAAVFRSDAWHVPPVFHLIQERGGVERAEMYRVFNMGVGMVLICSPARVDQITGFIPEARIIGEVVNGQGEERVSIA
jgi:phosphoribosylformylglycinamidine cyclo-ligase